MGIIFEPLGVSKDSPMVLDAVKRHWRTYTCKITRTGYHKLKPNKTPWRSIIILSYFPSLWRISFYYILCWTTGRSLRKSKSQPGHTKSIDNYSASWTWNKKAHCFGKKEEENISFHLFSLKMSWEMSRIMQQLDMNCDGCVWHGNLRTCSCKQIAFELQLGFVRPPNVSEYTEPAISQHGWDYVPWGQRSLWSHQNKCLSLIWKCLRRIEWLKYWRDVSFSCRDLEQNSFHRSTAASHV